MMKNQQETNKIPCEIIRSKRKTLSLTVTSEAKLVIRAPWGLPDKRIREFINQKSDWINRRIQYAHQNKPAEKSYEEGEQILYMGKHYPLRYMPDSERIVDFREHLFIRENVHKNIKQVLRSWYIYQGYQIIPRRVKELAERLSYEPSGVKITRAERRWGSCSSKGSLCFSWRLMMAPMTVIDYVIIHELVHLEIRDHFGRFWARIEEILPEYRERKRWLKDNDRIMRL